MMIALLSFLLVERGTIKSCVGHEKITEYCREIEILSIYYIDMHKCPLKPNIKKYRLQIREAVFQNRGLGGCTIQQAKIDETVTACDIQEPWRGKIILSYTNLRYEKAELACKNPDKHLLEAVGILKKATDIEDKYIIYKINNSQFKRKQDYIFKSSGPMAQVANDMGQDGPENPLQCKEA